MVVLEKHHRVTSVPSVPLTDVGGETMIPSEKYTK